MDSEQKWFYLGADDVPRGPVGREELLDLVRLGVAREDAMVWRDGFSGWKPYRDVEQELKNPVVQPAPAPSPIKRAPTTEPLPKQLPTRQSAAVQARPRIARAHLTVGLAFVTAAIVLVTVLYKYSDPMRADESSPAAMLPQAERSNYEFREAGPLPVRVQNPFDASEVFEFPPGTSAADARDAVADVLMKRAAERRNRRKPG
jgi:hypothetical protein